MVSGSEPLRVTDIEGNSVVCLAFHPKWKTPAFMLNGPILASVWAIPNFHLQNLREEVKPVT